MSLTASITVNYLRLRVSQLAVSLSDKFKHEYKPASGILLHCEMQALTGNFLARSGLRRLCVSLQFTSRTKPLFGSDLTLKSGRSHLSTSSSACAIIQHLPRERKSRDNGTLVVLYGWLMAKSKHLEKVGNIYNNLGADVITVKPNVAEVLRPTKAEELASKILDTLQSSDLNNKTIFIHGFSVGGYMYAQTLNKIVTEAKYASVKDRIIGQVFDSPVDIDNIPYGVANAATNNVLLSKAMKYSIESYLKLTRKHTVDKFSARSKLFYNNPVRAPSLFLFSKDDPVSLPEVCERCVAIWRDDLGMDVTVRKWDSSAHVSHFYRHREEYTSLVIDHFKKVNNN